MPQKYTSNTRAFFEAMVLSAGLDASVVPGMDPAYYPVEYSDKTVQSLWEGFMGSPTGVYKWLDSVAHDPDAPPDKKAAAKSLMPWASFEGTVELPGTEWWKGPVSKLTSPASPLSPEEKSALRTMCTLLDQQNVMGSIPADGDPKLWEVLKWVQWALDQDFSKDLIQSNLLMAMKELLNQQIPLFGNEEWALALRKALKSADITYHEGHPASLLLNKLVTHNMQKKAGHLAGVASSAAACIFQARITLDSVLAKTVTSSELMDALLKITQNLKTAGLNVDTLQTSLKAIQEESLKNSVPAQSIAQS